MPPQTEEQKQNAFQAAGLNQNQIERVRAGLPQQAPDPSEIDVETMKEPSEQALRVPEPPQIPDFQRQIDANLENITQFLQQPTQTEETQGDLQQRILESLETLGGEQAQRRELEEEAGIPEQQRQLQELVGQLQTLQKESQAIPLQIQQDFAGRGATRGGVEPIEAGRLRENAIKSLQLSAQAQTLQGNIALAQQNINSAIEAEFSQEEARLQTLKQLYAFNRDELNRIAEERRDIAGRFERAATQKLEFALQERERTIQQRKADREAIYQTGILARKNGADTDTVQSIFDSATPEEAVANAGGSLRDPAADLELKSIKLNNQLKKSQIEKVRREINAINNAAVNDIKGKTKEQKEAERKAEAAIPVMEEKIDLIDGLKKHSGLDSRVGPTIFARASGGFGGVLSRVLGGVATGAATGAGVGALAGGVGAIPGALVGAGAGLLGGGGLATQGVGDAITGSGSNFASSVHQLVDGLALQELIESKQRGATYGQLSNQELRIISTSATKLADLEIKDERGNGTGFWDTSEEVIIHIS